MLFNSIEFAIFLPIVFLLYWFVFNRQERIRNLFIIVVSYIFYGWWDWRFLLLIAFTSLCSYLSGVGIESVRRNERGGGTPGPLDQRREYRPQPGYSGYLQVL